MPDHTEPIAMIATTAMQASSAAVGLVKQFEELCLVAYLCPANIPTIGWGHTHGVHLGQEITEPFAEQLLHEDVIEVGDGVSLLFGALRLTQGQFDALVRSEKR